MRRSRPCSRLTPALLPKQRQGGRCASSQGKGSKPSCLHRFFHYLVVGHDLRLEVNFTLVAPARWMRGRRRLALHARKAANLDHLAPRGASSTPRRRAQRAKVSFGRYLAIARVKGCEVSFRPQLHWIQRVVSEHGVDVGMLVAQLSIPRKFVAPECGSVCVEAWPEQCQWVGQGSHLLL